MLRRLEITRVEEWYGGGIFVRVPNLCGDCPESFKSRACKALPCEVPGARKGTRAPAADTMRSYL